MMTLVYHFIDRGRGADLCVTCGVGALEVQSHALYHARRDDTPWRFGLDNPHAYEVTIIDGKAYIGKPKVPFSPVKKKPTTRRKRK